MSPVGEVQGSKLARVQPGKASGVGKERIPAPRAAWIAQVAKQAQLVLQGGLGASQVSRFRIAGGSLSPPVSGQQAQGIRVPATQPCARTAGEISSADGAVPGVGSAHLNRGAPWA